MSTPIRMPSGHGQVMALGGFQDFASHVVEGWQILEYDTLLQRLVIPQVHERVHALCGIPPTAQVVYCIRLGYPQGRFGPNQRKPLTEVCSYDHWATAPAWR